MSKHINRISVTGVCMIEDLPIPCIGDIEVIKINGRSIYVSWKMTKTNGDFIAAVSRNYFIDKEDTEQYDVIHLVLENIKNYRTNRKKIFSNIEVTDM